MTAAVDTKATAAELWGSFAGEPIQPGDVTYDEHRRVWNGAIDRSPALIARCRGVADVIAAIRFARCTALPVAVRGGGHSYPGHSVCDGGIVIAAMVSTRPASHRLPRTREDRAAAWRQEAGARSSTGRAPELDDLRLSGPALQRRSVREGGAEAPADAPAALVRSEPKPGASGHHRRAARAHGRDDLFGVDPLEIDRGGAETGVAELALDDVQRHALVRELERVGVVR